VHLGRNECIFRMLPKRTELAAAAL
jgi:hypothetical protein